MYVPGTDSMNKREIRSKDAAIQLTREKFIRRFLVIYREFVLDIEPKPLEIGVVRIISV